MKRLTTNKNVSEMGMYELAMNSCYSKDGLARYRDFEKDVDARVLTRELLKKYAEGDDAFESVDAFDDEMLDFLQYGTDTIEGLIALFYLNLWTKADLRERLKDYEDAEEQRLLLRLPCKVGDVVAIVLYLPSKRKRFIQQAEVKEINIGKYNTREDIQLKVEPISKRGVIYKYYLSEWGENVFSTLTEAEKALADMGV